VVVEDPVMMRGGCQVLTPTSRVDARLETRLGKVLSELLGGQRQLDGRDPDPA
jgi:flagellar assembly protein FliH